MAMDINMEALFEGVKKKRTKSLNDPVLPRGITRVKFDRFMRVMRAMDSSEIEDISIEDIAAMFVDCDKLVNVVYGKEDIFLNPDQLMDKLKRAKSVGAKRRIL